MLTILNTSIITDYGYYRYEPITLEEAKDILNCTALWQSAIGHESTAQIISKLLGIDCWVNRFAYRQQHAERALIFKLNGRPPEGKILTLEEIEEIGYTWGLLTRID